MDIVTVMGRVEAWPFVELFVFVESPWEVRGYRYGNGMGGGMAVCGNGKYFDIIVFDTMT